MMFFCLLFTKLENNSLPPIRRFIIPVSLVITDCVKVYETLSSDVYFHLTLNHKENFVNHRTGVAINRLVSQWQKIKQKKERYGKKGTLQGHLKNLWMAKGW